MSQVQGASSANYAAQWQYLQSIQQSHTGAMGQPSAGDPMSFGLDPFSGASGQPSGSGGSGPPFSLDAMSALIAAQEQSGTSGLSQHQQNVFGELDTDDDGKVTGAELQSAFGSDNAGIAKYVMSKLDTDGDGAISQSEFGAGTTRGAGGHRHHHMHAGPPPDVSQGAQGGKAAQDPLAALLSSSTDGASSQISDNSDGSTTTTITYADGSKVSMTSAAAASGPPGSNGSVSGNPQQQTQQNLLEQLIKLQAQLTQNFSATSSVVTI